jgi:hypothetical protein
MTTTIGSFTPPASLPTPPPSAPAPLAQPQTVLRTFRDGIRQISPIWLRGKVGGSILYAAASILDDLMDGLTAGIKMRFPGLYSEESLGPIGRERRIRRGRYETGEQYADRLIRWLDDHRLRGGPYAMLEQLHAHYRPNSFPIELRYASGRRFLMDVDGNITRGDIVWTPPGDPARWARWWLFYTWPDPIDDEGVWGPGTTQWGDGGVWGSSLSPAEVRDLRLVPREWNAQHCIGRIVVVSPLETVNLSTEGP